MNLLLMWLWIVAAIVDGFLIGNYLWEHDAQRATAYSVNLIACLALAASNYMLSKARP